MIIPDLFNCLASLAAILRVELLLWMPLVIAGLAGPLWLVILYWRRSVIQRRLSLRLEEDFVP